MTWGWTRRVRLVRGEGQDVPGWYGVRDAACPLGTRGGEGGGGLVRLGQQRVQRPRPDERVQRACEPAHPDRVDRVSARLRARRRVRPLEPLLSTGRLGRQWSRYSIGSVVTLQYRVGPDLCRANRALAVPRDDPREGVAPRDAGARHLHGLPAFDEGGGEHGPGVGRGVSD